MKTMFKAPGNGSRLLASVFLGLLVAAGSAAAGNDVRTVAVRYGDLDLSREEGIRTLYGRLEAAAGRVCGPRMERDLNRRHYWHECREEALARAVSEIGNTRLAALHGVKRTRQS